MSIIEGVAPSSVRGGGGSAVESPHFTQSIITRSVSEGGAAIMFAVRFDVMSTRGMSLAKQRNSPSLPRLRFGL